MSIHSFINLQFKERYLALRGQSSPKLSVRLARSKISTLLREISDDEDDLDASTGSTMPEDPAKPWMRDFRAYLDVLEHIPDGWTAVRWWGVSEPQISLLKTN
jgi:hypothetical protein